MRTKVTLVLIFLNVALFFFIFYFEGPRVSEESRAQARRLVLGSTAANIQNLEIAGPTETIALERRPTGWFLTAPLEWPASETAVRKILNELEMLERDASFTKADLEKNGMTLADYGLDKPALTLTFTPGTASGETGTEHTPVVLRVGNESQGGNRLYVLSPDGERVLVVKRSLADSLRLSVDQLRSDAIFTIPNFEVSSLSFQAAAANNLRVRLILEAKRWSFVSPIRTRASKTSTELTINALNALVARSFPSPQNADLARTGLASPTYRIALEGINRSEVLLVGSVVPADPKSPTANSTDEVLYYGKLEGRPTVFITAFSKKIIQPEAANGRDLLATLRESQEALRERQFLDLDSKQVSAISLKAPGQPELTLQRLEGTGTGADLGTWQIVRREPAAGTAQTLPADSAAVNRLLQQLVYLKANTFLSDAPSAADLENWGFSRPQREISLTLEDASARSRAGAPSSQIALQLGLASEKPNPGAKNDLIYARLDKQDFVYLVDASILKETPVVARAFREKLLRELPAGALITGLKLTKMDGTVIYERKLADNETWTSALTGEAPAKKEAIETLLQQLRTLRAKSIVVDAFSPKVSLDGEEQPWTYRLDTTLALVTGAGAKTEDTMSTLFISERTGGGTQLAGSPDFGGAVFEIEQPFLDALWKLTYGPRDPGRPASETVPKPATP